MSASAISCEVLVRQTRLLVMERATAAHLPPELVYWVVQRLMWRRKKDSSVDKLGLAACSLTCRFWAKVLRIALFGKLTLRSRLDMAQLEEFMNVSITSGPCIIDCLRDLTIEQDGPQTTPWLHHIHALYKRLANVRVEVFLRSSLYPGAPTTHRDFIGSALPRTLPGSVFPIQCIAFHNLHLRRTTDLLRFVDYLPMLQECICCAITFEDTTMASRPYPRRPWKLHRAQVSGCGDGTLQAQLTLASTIIAAGERLEVHREAWDTGLVAMLSFLPEVCAARSIVIEHAGE